METIILAPTIGTLVLIAVAINALRIRDQRELRIMAQSLEQSYTRFGDLLTKLEEISDEVEDESSTSDAEFPSAGKESTRETNIWDLAVSRERFPPPRLLSVIGCNSGHMGLIKSNAFNLNANVIGAAQVVLVFAHGSEARTTWVALDPQKNWLELSQELQSFLSEDIPANISWKDAERVISWQPPHGLPYDDAFASDVLARTTDW